MTLVTLPADAGTRLYGRDQLRWLAPAFAVPGLEVPVTKIVDDPKTGAARFQAVPLVEKAGPFGVGRQTWFDIALLWIDGEIRWFTQPVEHKLLVVQADVMAEDPTWPWVIA